MECRDKLRQKLAQLVEEHKSCEAKLAQQMRAVVPSCFEIRLLKKNKLELKDQIQSLKNKINPDIIA